MIVMYAINLREFGPAENLRYEEVADPEPGPGQVLITVKAAGVHLLDASLRSGETGGAPIPLPELPAIPGREVAGVVSGLGAGVDESWLGKRVVAHLGVAGQGYAELAVRAVEAVHEVPGGLGFEVAVAMIGTGRTAMGILEVAQLTADDVVLVTAAAGAIGTLLVQAAKNAGATVAGVAGGAAKVERVRAAGADVAVDYNDPDWAAQVRAGLGDSEPTVVLDGVGGEPGGTALKLLGTGGRIIQFGWSAGEPTQITTETLVAGGLTASFAVGARILKRPGGLRGLEEASLAAAASGALVPAVQTFPLKDAAAAHTALVSRATAGKVVLVP